MSRTVMEKSETARPAPESAQPADAIYDIRPEKTACPEDAELHWYRNVYQGDVPQLTLRAVVMGAFLGGFMALSNLYVGLKTGWALGVAITACILSFSLHKLLMTLFPRLFATEMTILESTCMQTTASSAGYSTGGTMVSAISAFLIVTGHHVPWLTLTLWTVFLALLGISMAIPMKRQMINIEQLKFPSGIAAAETLKSLHSKGGEAVKKARILAGGGIFGGLVACLRDAAHIVPDKIALGSWAIMGKPLAGWTISLDGSAIMIAAGAIIGWRTCWSLLLGGIINYGILAPKMAALGVIDISQIGYREIVRWSTWAGASMMVTSGLLMFAMQWKTSLRAFSGLAAIFSRKKECESTDPLANVEPPVTWFAFGTLFAGLCCMLLLHYAFQTTFLMGAVAVAVTFLLAIVACRVTGETDTTPMGAMGKITQLTFGILAPSNMATNLMTASVTANAASTSADLLTSLKTGYLLGANPRKMFIAQFLGIFAGTLVVVPAFYLLVPNASVLGTDQWPAPSAQVWAAVARLLANGFESLHPTAKMGMLIGGLVGILIPLAEMKFPEYKKYIPSATGIGLAMVIPFYNSLSMFLGALAVMLVEKKKPALSEMWTIPLASGIIAGESILGVAVALLAAAGILH
ncbi:MAG: OPT family oligopeptide transporter [Elusimicrobiales bacterium]